MRAVGFSAEQQLAVQVSECAALLIDFLALSALLMAKATVNDRSANTATPNKTLWVFVIINSLSRKKVPNTYSGRLVIKIHSTVGTAYHLKIISPLCCRINSHFVRIFENAFRQLQCH